MSERGFFNGRRGFIIATAASAVGLGNIWRFPTEAAKHGGGTFVLIYIIIVLIFGLVMMMTEIAIGRKTRKSPIEAYTELHPKARIIGILSSWVPAIILPYYCVIGGWLIAYLCGYCVGTDLTGSSYFMDFAGSYEAVAAFAVFAVFTAAVVYLGVSKGIEKFSLIFMPIFLVLLVALVIYCSTLPGAGDGIAYYFGFHFEDVDASTFTAALGQAFFSLSIAMGILITYGSYFSKDESIERCSVSIILIDTAVAITAGLLIIPMAYVYAPEAMAGGGAGLVFITLPQIFSMIPAGHIIAIVFFVMILFAAVTSAVSVLEVVSSTVIDSFKKSRTVAVTIVMIPTIIAGVCVSLGYGPLDFIVLDGKNLLDLFDYVSNTLLMPIVAILCCILVGHIIGTKVIQDEVQHEYQFFGNYIYPLMIKWVCPILVAIIFISSFIKF